MLQDPRHLTKYEKSNSSTVKISDLLPKKGGASEWLDVSPCTLYLLYEIKKLPVPTSEDEPDMDTEEEDELAQ